MKRISTEILRQIARDCLQDEGWYIQAKRLFDAANEIDRLVEENKKLKKKLKIMDE